MASLYEKLVMYSNDGYYPMHMPGHKRNEDMLKMVSPYCIDITEIEGFDDLHDPNEILAEVMNRVKDLYHSEESYLLINGSTVGILAGIAAATKKGDKILLARNCHKSVYNAIVLNELIPIYIYPQMEEEFGVNGGISPIEVEKLLIEHPDIRLVVITSPTYEGLLSNIERIAETVHNYNIPLLVDEAHGAHFGFHHQFPDTSISAKADIVIHSVHKTLPSFTQTALIHINGSIVDSKEIRRYLSIYQSSSPSYLLIVGIDQCMKMLEERSYELFELLFVRLQKFRDNMKLLQQIKVIDDTLVGTADIFDYDKSKIVISVKSTNMTGQELYDILLKRYKIQMELVSKDYVLAITSICDTQEGFDRLSEALLEIDKDISGRKEKENTKDKVNFIKDSDLTKNIPLVMELTPYDVYNKENEIVPFEQSEGRISYEYAYLYPPGIPIIVPGERINREIILKLKHLKQARLKINGMEDKNLDYIKVVVY